MVPLSLVVLLLAFSFIHGADITVTQEGGIRGAVAVANDGDNIIIPSGTYTGTNNLLLLLQGRTLSFESETGDPVDTIVDCNFQGIAVGVFYANASDPRINNPTSLSFSGISFQRCWVVPGTGLTSTAGAFYVNSVGVGAAITIHIVNCNFDNNYATYGGAIYAIDANRESPLIHISIFSSTFSNNTAGAKGAALFAENGPLIDIQQCNFYNNTAMLGAALYIFTTTSLTISNSDFSKNNAMDPLTGQYYYGGAIYLDTASVTVKQVNFSTNIAGYGGAIAVYQSDLVIQGGNYEHNRAIGDGGAIYAYIGTSGVSTATISDASFQQNIGGSGGAICMSQATASISNCSFDSNQANLGGALAATQNAQITLRGSTVGANTAESGGGIYTEGGATFSITGCTLNRNRATEDGDSVYCNHANMTIAKTQFLYNTARPNEPNGLYCNNYTSTTVCDITILDSGDWPQICLNQTALQSATTTGFSTTGPGDVKKHDDNNMPGWKIAVIVVGVIVGAVLVSLFIYFNFIMKRTPHPETEEEDGTL